MVTWFYLEILDTINKENSMEYLFRSITGGAVSKAINESAAVGWEVHSFAVAGPRVHVLFQRKGTPSMPHTPSIEPASAKRGRPRKGVETSGADLSEG